MSNKVTAKPSFADLFANANQFESYFVDLSASQYWLTFMGETEAGRAAAKKLLDAAIEKDKVWGLSIPKKKGLTTKERISINNQSETKSDAQLAYNLLVVEVAQKCKEEKGQEPDVATIADLVAKAVNQGVFTLEGEDAALVLPYVEKIQEIQDKFNSTHYTVPQVTHLLACRLKIEWSEEETLMLHEQLFNELLKIFRAEQEYKPVSAENNKENPTPVSAASKTT